MFRRDSISPRARQRGYTILELVVAVGVSMSVGLIALTFSNSTLQLFAKNFSLNESHIRARDVIERASWLLHQCVQSPQLVDENGADVAAGPASGVRVLRYASTGLYRTAVALAPTSTTITIKTPSAGMPYPHVGDMIVLQYQDPSTTTNNSGTIQATITAVSGTGPIVLTFASAMSNYFSPYTAAAWSIPVDKPISLLTNSSLVTCVKNGLSELRYYPLAMTVADDGQTNFDNPANFRVLANLQPLNGATKAFPFSYSDAAHRRVDLTVRAISTKYSGRGFKEFVFFESIHSSTAYRSAVQKNLQP